VTTYRGITWDHPRGKNALLAAASAAAASGGPSIEWEAHSLEHFESHPIDELASRYDLIVLDHPHLGEALEKHSLQPMDAVVGAAQIERWSRESVGPSFDSYSADGYQWALPLDAATQVAVHKPALLGAVPDTWDEVEALSAGAPVALSLAGPHAFLTFASICAAFGEPVGSGDGSAWLVSGATASRVLELMRSIASRAPAGTESQNPIALLERLADTDDIAYCPLVYGYVTYSSREVRFTDAPRAIAGGRRGSTIGGTGLAVSARATVTPELVEHISWLLSAEAQCGFIPQHEGQPSARAAWLDAWVNRAAHDFYRSTLATIEDSWVRPRFAGYIPFQSEASALVRDAVSGRASLSATLPRLRNAFAASRSHEHVKNAADGRRSDFSTASITERVHP
jgi:multiple sugar transport system substrate-binding protein